MKPVVYVDHIKDINESIELNSMVQSISNPNFVGIYVGTFGTSATVKMYRALDGHTCLNIPSHWPINDLKAVKCKITIK